MNDFDQVVAQLARQAGLYAKEKQSTLRASTKNDDPRDVVTNIDLEITAHLRERITELFPDHGFYSEEDQTDISTAGYTWAIDPINGTSNYIRSIPYYSSCVTLLCDGQVVSAAIYAPVLDELFQVSAEGVFLNNEPLRVGVVEALVESYVNFHAGRKKEYRQWAGDTKIALLGSAKKSFDTSSSALDLCYLAAGRTDVVIYGSLTTLDIAGAIAIVRAAGGEVYNYDTRQPVKFLSTPQRIIATASEALRDDFFAQIAN